MFKNDQDQISSEISTIHSQVNEGSSVIFFFLPLDVDGDQRNRSQTVDDHWSDTTLTYRSF